MLDFNKGNRRRVFVERLCVCVNLKKKRKSIHKIQKQKGSENRCCEVRALSLYNTALCFSIKTLVWYQRLLPSHTLTHTDTHTETARVDVSLSLRIRNGVEGIVIRPRMVRVSGVQRE